MPSTHAAGHRHSSRDVRAGMWQPSCRTRPCHAAAAEVRCAPVSMRRLRSASLLHALARHAARRVIWAMQAGREQPCWTGGRRCGDNCDWLRGKVGCTRRMPAEVRVAARLVTDHIPPSAPNTWPARQTTRMIPPEQLLEPRICARAIASAFSSVRARGKESGPACVGQEATDARAAPRRA